MLFGMAQNVHVWCIGAMQSFLKRSHTEFLLWNWTFFAAVAASSSSSSLIHLLVYPLGLCLSRQQIHYFEHIVGSSSTASPLIISHLFCILNETLHD